MKKLLTMVIGAAMVLAMAGCSGTAANVNSDKLTVVTTIFPPYDFVREIGGSDVEVKMLVAAGGEAHSYEPTPNDIIAVQDCDIFITTGGEADIWCNDILAAADTSKVKVIKMMDCVDALEEEIVEGMEDDEHDSDVHEHEEAEQEGEEAPEYDEHVWTSPANSVKICEKIAAVMSELDSDKAAAYNANLKTYTEKLNTLSADLKAMVSESGKRTVVFGDRFPFRYLFEELGLNYYAAFPGCSSETDASAATIAFLVDKVKELNINSVFYLETGTHKIADTIAAESGAQTALLHSCHTLTQAELDADETYLTLMYKNLDNLKKALA